MSREIQIADLSEFAASRFDCYLGPITIKNEVNLDSVKLSFDFEFHEKSSQIVQTWKFIDSKNGACIVLDGASWKFTCSTINDMFRGFQEMHYIHSKWVDNRKTTDSVLPTLYTTTVIQSAFTTLAQDEQKRMIDIIQITKQLNIVSLTYNDFVVWKSLGRSNFRDRQMYSSKLVHLLNISRDAVALSVFKFFIGEESARDLLYGKKNNIPLETRTRKRIAEMDWMEFYRRMCVIANIHCADEKHNKLQESKMQCANGECFRMRSWNQMMDKSQNDNFSINWN